MTNQIKIQLFFCKFQKNFTHFRRKKFAAKNVAILCILRYTVTQRGAGALPNGGRECRCMKRFIDRTLVEYLIVGILNFILCTGIMFLLFNLWGVSTHLAPLVNYGLGSVNWYLSCKFIVFRERQSTGQQLLRFVTEVLICYLVSYYVIARPCAALLLRSERVSELFAFGGAEKVRGNCEMTVGAFSYAILNYFGQRYFVFNRRFEHHHKK